MKDLVEISKMLPVLPRRVQRVAPYMGHQEMSLQIVEKLVNSHRLVIIGTPTRQKSLAFLWNRIICFTISFVQLTELYKLPQGGCRSEGPGCAVDRTLRGLPLISKFFTIFYGSGMRGGLKKAQRRGQGLSSSKAYASPPFGFPGVSSLPGR